MKKIILVLSILIMVLIQSNIAIADSVGELNLYVGDKIDLDAYLVKEKVVNTDGNIIWKIGNTSVVTIDSNGVVYAQKEGRAFVNAIVKSGEKSISTSIVINVKSNVDRLHFKSKTILMKSGDVYKPEYEITQIDKNINIANKSIKLMSSNSEIVRVDGDSIKALKDGEAYIYGYTQDKNKLDKFLVKVSGEIKDIKMSQTDREEYYIGEKVDLDVIDDQAYNLVSGITFKSSNPNIASVDQNGLVTFNGIGTVIIEATSSNGKKTAAVFNVKSMLLGVNVEPKSIVFTEIGQTNVANYELILRDKDIEPIIGGVTWRSINTSIASVENGVIKAVGPGITKVIVRSNDGGFEGAISVTVDLGEKNTYRNVEKLEVDVDYGTVVVGEEMPINLSIYPENATNKNITVYVDKSSVGSVYYRNGRYYFLGTSEGKAKVTFKSASEKEDTVELSVKSPLKSIDVSTELQVERSSYIAYLGQKIDLGILFEPREGYNQEDILEKGYRLIDKNSAFRVLKYDDDMISIVPVKLGYNPIKIVSKDGEKSKSISLNIQRLANEIIAPQSDQIMVGEAYKPDVEYGVGQNIYGITELENLDYSLRIIEEYISLDYIYSEIEYEKNMINELDRRIKDNPESYLGLRHEINIRKERKIAFENAIKYSKDNYVKVVNGLKLTDRQGNGIDIATYSKETITGNYRGYAVYQALSSDGLKSKTSKVYFTSQLGGLVLKDNGDNIISSSSNQALIDYNEKTKKDGVYDRFGDSGTEDIPLEEYIDDIMNFESKIDLDAELKVGYREQLDYESALRIMINIFEKLTGRQAKYTSDAYFNDDTTGIGGIAYNFGIIGRNKNMTLDPSRVITMKEFNYLFNRTLNSVSKVDPKYSQNILILEPPIIKTDYPTVGLDDMTAELINSQRNKGWFFYNNEPIDGDEVLNLEKALMLINQIIK